MTVKGKFLLLLSEMILLVLSGCWNSSDAETGESGPKGPFAVLFHIDGDIPPFARSTDLLGAPATSQYQLSKLLRRAAADPNVQEVVIHLGATTLSLARAGEIVEVVRAVASKGKPVVCHIDSVDNIGYWIAARACPRIMVSPAGGVEALGLSMEAVYLKDLLTSLGIFADIVHIGEYKSAAEPLTLSEMSAPARESAEGLLFELHRILVEGIAEGRKLDSAAVQSLLDSGPFNAKETVANGLADEIRTLQSHLDALAGKYAGGVVDDYGKTAPKQFSLTDLMAVFGKQTPKEETPGPKIALVPLVGHIMGGRSEELIGGMNIVRDMEVARTLSEIGRDETIRAVVLRIDSPGGSPLASDNIWNAVTALAKKKPVVASMGDVAASGGYYIAAGATEVFAEPATVTGSIGVVGGKLVFTEAAKKIGINTQRIQTGKRAALNSPFVRFSEDERMAVRKLMTDYYDLFVDRVVTGRGLTREKVLASAKGRVWTGSQAKRIGLVDRMGSLQKAVARARKLGGLPATAPVVIRPKPRSFMELLGEAISQPQVSVTQALAGRHPSLGQSLGLASLLVDEPVLAILPTAFYLR